MKSGEKVVGYIRVSTHRQEADGNSLDNQAALIRDWAVARQMQLLGIYEDVGSARLSGNVVKRVGLTDAVAHANREDASLVVTRFDRMSRNSDELPSLLGSFTGEVHSIGEGRSLSSTRPDRPLHALIAKAQAEAERIAERTAAAHEAARSAGKVFGSPGNQQLAGKASGRVRGSKADIIVERIAEFLEEDPARRSMTAKKVAAELNARGVKTGGRRKWTVEALRRPLRDAKALQNERDELAALPEGYLF